MRAPPPPAALTSPAMSAFPPSCVAGLRQGVQLGGQVSPVHHPTELIHDPPTLKEQHGREGPYPIALGCLRLGFHVECGDRHPAPKRLR